jgi:hypothetical protein
LGERLIRRRKKTKKKKKKKKKEQLRREKGKTHSCPPRVERRVPWCHAYPTPVICRQTEEVEVAPGLQVDVRATAVKEVPPPIIRVAVAVGVTVLPFPPPLVCSRGKQQPITSYPANVGFAMQAMGLVEYPDCGPHLLRVGNAQAWQWSPRLFKVSGLWNYITWESCCWDPAWCSEWQGEIKKKTMRKEIVDRRKTFTCLMSPAYQCLLYEKDDDTKKYNFLYVLQLRVNLFFHTKAWMDSCVVKHLCRIKFLLVL